MAELSSGMSVMSLTSSATPTSERDSKVPHTTPTAQVEEVKCLITRPGLGTLGRRIPLRANYYELTLSHEIFVHRYEITIRRPGKERKLDRDFCRDAFWKAAQAYPDVFGKLENLIYDDANCLWTKEKLGMNRGEITLDVKRQNTNFTEYIMIVKYTTSFVVNIARDETSKCVSVQFLDALITQSIRCPLRPISEDFYPFGRSVYLIPNPIKKIGWKVDVGGGIEAWTGLHGAVKIDQNGKPLFNADISTSAFYKFDMPLIDFYLEIMNEFRGGTRRLAAGEEDLRNMAMDDRSRRSLKKVLTGLNLRLMYGEESSRKRDFRFQDVLGPASTIRFLHKDRNDPNDPGQEVTVEEYFRKYKDIVLRFPNLPVIQVGPKNKKICIPMELLKLSDRAQKVKKELSEFQKSKMIRGAALSPLDRRERIEYLISGQNLEEDVFLVNYQLGISNGLIGLDGRVLQHPALELHTDETGNAFHIDVCGGKWELRNQFTACPARVIFSIVIVDECTRLNDIERSYRVLVSACELFGFHFDSRDPVVVKFWRSDQREVLGPLVQFIKDESKKKYPEGLATILFLMSRKDPAAYGFIKAVCDIEKGIACQVLLAKTFIAMRGKPETNSTAHNICMKLNVKLGGINNKIYIPKFTVWSKFTNRDDPTVFIGIDVTHPGPGKRGNSIATVVGSVDLYATRYEATVKVQQPNAERVVYVVDALKERLLSFYSANDRSPAHIIIYRDGISESEFLDTLREEIGSAKAACKKLDPTYDPTITYIVVQKRHHTRFFVENPKDAVSENVPPGTCVDERVSSSTLFDFFLASHLGAIGTSRPSHYYTLYDSWRLSADELQQVTFALCHLYGRCNRSVSIPAPVYYAHLACARASVHDNALFGSRSSYGSSQGAEAGRSELETIRSQQTALCINRAAPQMYFV